MNAAQGPFFLQHWVKGHPSESIIIWCLPVDAQSAQAQHRDPHWGLLHEGHQLAQRHPEGPILCEQLERERQVYGRFKTFPMGIFPFAALSLIRNPAITTCEPKFTPSESSFALMFSVFSLLCIFFFLFHLSWFIWNHEPGCQDGSWQTALPRSPLTERVSAWPWSLLEPVECKFRSIGIICGSVSLWNHQLLVWYATMSSCFSMPAPLPKYTGPIPPQHAHTCTHGSKQIMKYQRHKGMKKAHTVITWK